MGKRLSMTARAVLLWGVAHAVTAALMIRVWSIDGVAAGWRAFIGGATLIALRGALSMKGARLRARGSRVVLSALFGAAFGGAFAMGAKVYAYLNGPSAGNQRLVAQFSLVDVANFAAVALCFFLVIFYAASLLERDHVALARYLNAGRAKPNAVFFTALAAFLFAWSGFLITYFPGTCISDTVWILEDPVGMSTQHPFFYCQLLYGLVMAGNGLFGHMNAGYALYTFAQMCYVAFSMAWALRWLAKKGCPTFLLAAFCAHFAFSRLMANIAVTGIKDGWFGATVVLLLPLFCDLAVSRGEKLESPKFSAALVGLGTVAALLRNNGLYVMALTMFVLLFSVRRYRIRLLLVAFLTLALPYGSNALAMRYVVKGEAQFTEMIAVPMQQICMTVLNGGEITDEQEAFIYRVVPREVILEHYSPTSFDKLKWEQKAKFSRSFLNQNKAEFFRVWAEMLPKNLGSYIQAYALLTSVFWDSFEHAYAQGYYTDIANPDSIGLGIENVQILPDWLQRRMDAWYQGYKKSMLGAGNVFLITLLLMGIAVSARERRKWIVFVPLTGI